LLLLLLLLGQGDPGANSTIVSYKASAVRITTLPVAFVVRFDNKKVFAHFEKTLWLTTTLALYLQIQKSKDWLQIGRIYRHRNLRTRRRMYQ
jgi:hypothetical protein